MQKFILTLTTLGIAAIAGTGVRRHLFAHALSQPIPKLRAYYTSGPWNGGMAADAMDQVMAGYHSHVQLFHHRNEGQ